MIRPIENQTIPYDLLLDADPDEKIIDEYIHTADIFIKVVENKTVGVIVLIKHSMNEIEVKNVAIHEQFRGKGFGKELISFAEKWAREHGFSSILIGTGNSSIDQLTLYQKLGFEMDSIKHNFFVDLYNEPIIENGIRCNHMIVLKKSL